MANTNIDRINHTEDVVFVYGKEDSSGNVAEWFKYDPNDVPTASPTYTRTARNTLSGTRDVKKGQVTNLESNVSINSDITLSNVINWLGSYMHCDPYRSEAVLLKPVSTTATAIVVEGDKTGFFSTGSLVSFKQEGQPEKVVALTNVAASGGNTTLTSTGAGFPVLNANAAGLNDIVVSGVGIRARAGSGADVNVSLEADGRVKLEQTGLVAKFTGDGVNFDEMNGMLICVKFHGASGSSNGFGYLDGRGTADQVFLRDPSTRLATYLDGQSATPADKNVDLTGNTYVDILFSIFIPSRNRQDPRYQKECYRFASIHPGLNGKVASGANAGEEISATHILRGNFGNTLEMSWAVNSLATMAFAFLGLDARMSVPNYTATGAKSTDADIVGSEAAKEEIFKSPLNTTNSFAQLKLKDIAGSEVETVFESLTIGINNNASPKNVINKLGAWNINVGQFEATISGTAIYQDPAIQRHIVEGTDISLNAIARSEDGAFSVEFPEMTLQDGSLAYPDGDFVNVTLNGMAHIADGANYSAAFSAILTETTDEVQDV